MYLVVYLMNLPINVLISAVFTGNLIAAAYTNCQQLLK